MYSNKLKNRNSILIGKGQMRVAKAEDHITETDFVLTEINSLGYLAEIKLDASKEVEVRKSVVSNYPIDIQSKITDVIIECEPLEMTVENITMALGQDNLNNVNSSLDGFFGIGGESETWWRVEIGVLFPQGGNKMELVFPKTKIISDFSIPLMSEEAFKQTLTYQAADASFGEPSNAIWMSNPLGIWKFSSN